MHFLQNMTGIKLGAILTAAVLALGILFPVSSPIKAEAFQNSDYVDEYGEFLYAIGTSESGNSYSATNGQYLGYWQMGNAALQEAGFLDSSGNWTELAATFGVTDKESFLQSEAGQDYAVLAYHKRIYYYACNMGVDDYIGTEVSGVEMSFAGMIVGAHALGVGGLKKLIVNGTSGSTGNDSVALRYMQNYGIYDIEATILGKLPDVTVTTASTTATTTAATTTTTASATTTTTAETTTTAITTTTSETTAATTTTTTTASTTTTTATETTTVPTTTSTTGTTELKAPAYIGVKPEADVVMQGDVIRIYVESDTAEHYIIKVTAPGNTSFEYFMIGSVLGFTAENTGIYTIDVTAVNSAGESSAESVFVSVQTKPVVNEENIGDANSDGIVDITDASLILQYYACASVGAPMENAGLFNVYYADADDNGIIDLNDGALVLTYYARKAASIDVSWSELRGE